MTRRRLKPSRKAKKSAANTSHHPTTWRLRQFKVRRIKIKIRRWINYFQFFGVLSPLMTHCWYEWIAFWRRWVFPLVPYDLVYRFILLLVSWFQKSFCKVVLAMLAQSFLQAKVLSFLFLQRNGFIIEKVLSVLLASLTHSLWQRRNGCVVFMTTLAVSFLCLYICHLSYTSWSC